MIDHPTPQSEGSDRVPDVVTRYRPDTIATFAHDDQTFTFTCANGVSLYITVVTDRIFRLRYALEGELMPDFSYAIDPQFQPPVPELHFEEFEDFYAIATYQVTCQIMKDGLLVNFFDQEGNAICEDDTGFYLRESLMEGISSIKVTKKAPRGKQYFGLGDKSCSLDLRGHALENWCTDAFGYTPATDPLYRAIPFYQALHEGIGYGIFLDNSYRTRFSFDRTDNGVSSFSANGGEMNYYFIYGPSLTSVTQQYLELTGKPELPPLWALGFHQCKWSYYPDTKVREVARTFRALEIPCDAIYLDIDYMDEFRCFTWNKDFFPNPAALIADLKQDGFESVVMIDPGIKVDKDYWVHQEGLKGGYFCKREDGMLMKGPVWPSECHFPDFTHPSTRAWWGGLYRELVQEVGVSGFWNDMNEPAIFKINYKTFPDTVRHHYDGHHCSHKKAHNIYGMQMSRASLEGVQQLRPDKRPFLLTRATYAGGQRYAAAWTGDNIATWGHLHLANIQAQRMSISGFSFIGSDIGGFAENPTGELFVRWLQLGVFHPLMRVHSMGNHLDGGAPIDPEAIAELEASGLVQDQEPWSFGDEYTALAKAAIELRYRLLPYLYTAFQRYVTVGDPVLKPLSFYDQRDKNALKREEEFVFGNQILVAPVSSPDVRAQEVYLPREDWYHFWTGVHYEGQQEVHVATPLEHTPFFVAAGTVLPLAPVMQYTRERPIEEMTLRAYYKRGVAHSELYQDDGDGYGYRTGQYVRHTFELNGTEHQMVLRQRRQGDWKPPYRTFRVEVIGLPFDAVACRVDGQMIAPETDGAWVLPADFQEAAFAERPLS